MSNKAVIDKPLDERESSILRAIVHEYITTGKPVGSRSFVQKYSLSISPATMRNIMFDLESLQYLKQPHTSSGRIPTDRGYRFYVDSLLDSYDFSRNDEVIVSEDILRRELQLDRIYSQITRMLSNESHYAGIMMTPSPDFTVVKRIVLVPLDAGDILSILVTRTGMIISRKVVLSNTYTQDDLYEYSRYLTSELCGYAINEIRDTIVEKLRDHKVPGIDKDLALDIAQLAVTTREESNLHIDGIENLLKIPEMVEAERLQSLLNIIEEKNVLRTIMERDMDNDGVKTLIGGEIDDEKVTGCSMVSTGYKIGNKNVGVLGVIGPTRMDYEKVVPLVDYTGRVVSDLLTKLSK